MYSTQHLFQIIIGSVETRTLISDKETLTLSDTADINISYTPKQSVIFKYIFKCVYTHKKKCE